MTVTAQISSAQYAGNGVTTNFPWNGFRIDTASELQVVLINNTTLVETPTTNYTATGFGNDAGGNVVYPAVGSPLPTGQSIRVQRIVPYKQDLDISVESGFSPEVVEQQLDKMVMMIQQLNRMIVQISGASISGAGALPLTGGTLTGPLITVASQAAAAGIRMPHGVAPSAPVDGDFWSTTGAFFGRINGGTIQLATVAATVAKAGDTMTGALTTTDINISDAAATNRTIAGQTAGTNRWQMHLGTSETESGADAGSNFALARYSDAGALLSTAILINRASGDAKFSNKVLFGGDDNFYAWKNGSNNTQIFYDVNDSVEYDRAGDRWRWRVGGGSVWEVQGGFVQAWAKAYLNGGLILDPTYVPTSGTENGQMFLTPSGKSFAGRLQAADMVFIAAQFMALTANYTLVSQTAAQKAFNVGTGSNGAFNAKSATTYEFEGFINIDTMNATSGAFGFALAGTAVTAQVEYDTVGNKAALATAAAPQNTVNVGTTLPVANTAVVTATTNTVGWMRIKGTVRVTTAGTLIPQVSLGVANAARILAGSYFKFWPLGDNNVTTQGDIA